jgi:hypothetical protein
MSSPFNEVKYSVQPFVGGLGTTGSPNVKE